MSAERPELTFACELDPARLTALFADGSVAEDLLALKARVALMVSDFSDERAAVVRQLTTAGVPVLGIPLLPLEQGYYFTADNAATAAERYEQWKGWTSTQHLTWAGVGLDIEPDARMYQKIMDSPRGLIPMLVPRLFDRTRPARSRSAYRDLVERIHGDGWTVENYQFPLIADERRAGSTLLQRLALVDVTTDREVWMIYSSFMRALGPGLIWSYGPQAAAIGVGTTGGGPDIPGSPQMPSLSWEELARDLRLAWHWCDQILIHSLEGCVWHDYLGRLRSFDWTDTVAAPRQAMTAAGLRVLLRAALRASAHPWATLTGTSVACSLMVLAARHGRASTLMTRRTLQGSSVSYVLNERRGSWRAAIGV